MNDFKESSQDPNLEKDGKPLRIIYVEDNQGFSNFVQGELAKLQKEVQVIKSFSSTKQAKEYLIKPNKEDTQKMFESIDGFMMDFDLGVGENGGQFIKFLQEQGLEKPVVFYTSDVGLAEAARTQFRRPELVVSVHKLETPKAAIDILRQIKPQ